jgi:hypothetical protein
MKGVFRGMTLKERGVNTGPARTMVFSAMGSAACTMLAVLKLSPVHVVAAQVEFESRS